MRNNSIYRISFYPPYVPAYSSVSDAVEGEEVPLQPTTTHKIKRYKI